MGTCGLCQRGAKTISNTIGYCTDCIRDHFDRVWPKIKEVHNRSRRPYGLPLDPPRAEEGVPCRLCMHGCHIQEGSSGFCGLRQVRSGKVLGGRPHEGNVSYYYDGLPTNCVASFVCPAGTDAGYPRYSVASGPEYGYKNLAVFYEACSFNCLYCQNYHFKERTSSPARVSSRELAGAVDARTTCICYFGGDPTPQVLHALKTSRLALEGRGNSVLRICWETNGAARWPYLEAMARLSLESGGCVKIDLKAWDNRIHRALCGVDNREVLENFERLSQWVRLRPDPPLLVASTLLVPGYVDQIEVGALARFLARLDPEIPYSLLAFHPTFFLRDLPPTSTAHALGCLEEARKSGLCRVNLGNQHLLGDYY